MSSSGQTVIGEPKGFPPWVKTLLIILGCGFVLLMLAVAGLVYGIFYKISQSQPAQMSVALVQNNPQVREAVGEIKKNSWPIGSISVEGGGSGSATFSFKVKGSKGEGKAFTSLKKINGQWQMQSGRFQIKDGPSLNLQSAATTAGSLPSTTLPSGTAGGRPLKSDPGAVGQWREVSWPGQNLNFRVPADWMELKLDKKEIEYRPEDRSAYFIGNVTYFDQVIPFQALLQQDLQTKANQLKREEILGYKQLNIGGMQGILEIRGDASSEAMIVWNGYIDTPEFGTKSITFLLGATSLGSFPKAEPILGAILNSIR